MRTLSRATAVMLLVGGTPLGVAAQGEESFTTSQCYVEQIEVVTALAEERFAYVVTSMGTVRSASELFEASASRCFGLVSTFDEPGSGDGYCELLDADGDRVVVHWTATEPGRGEWRFVGGTGKFDGIGGEGSYDEVGEFPSFAADERLSCIETTGTYRLAE
jgi:hypothetical protein